jgi:DNA repair photolyase
MEIKGRGASLNPDNRFDKLHYDFNHEQTGLTEAELAENPPVHPKTQFFRDFSKSILAENNSPDLGFRYSINPYRGCEHGCAYCYARPTHEYLGFSAGIDFETKIMVKENAPDLLRDKFMSRSWQPELIVVSGNTDCYQPAERGFGITRKILQVMNEFKNPCAMITKNALITRDLDILKEMNEWNGISVTLSITSLDNDLIGVLEPRTSRAESRLRAVRELSQAGIPVNVNLAPMISGLNDHEIPAILNAAKEAGAISAAMIPVRLPLTVLPVFTQWLETHRPLRKEKVLSHIRDIRGGKLNDANFGSRMKGTGVMADQMRQLFKIYRKKYGLDAEYPELSTAHFKRPGDQLSLF